MGRAGGKSGGEGGEGGGGGGGGETVVDIGCSKRTSDSVAKKLKDKGTLEERRKEDRNG